MSVPRMRMIAGPNGSGKSTLFDYLRNQTHYPLGHCLNPDALERTLAEGGCVDFSLWGLVVDETELRAFLVTHPLAEKTGTVDVTVAHNALTVTPEAAGGYLVATLCDFMRRRWIETGQTFTFETVMSSPDKLDLLRTARVAGFRTYLYFICTDSARINRERIASRVSQSGHGCARGEDRLPI